MSDRQKIREAATVAEQLLARAAVKATEIVRDAKESTAEGLALMAKDIEYIRRDLTEIKGKMDKDYVSVDQFTPVRNIVYGMIGVLGLATMGALLKLIFLP